MKSLKKYWPYLLAILIFILLSYAFVPQIFQGKVINQSDTSSWIGMSKEAKDYNQTHDEPTRWTNSMFGGMPTATITMPVKGNFTGFIPDLLQKGKAPASYLFISLLGGFLLFLAFGTHPFLAIAGAVALTFCSYNVQIIQVGHITKMVAIAYMPWVLAALVYAFRKNALLGSVFFAFAVSFQVKANHPQITYYLGFLILALVIGQFFLCLQEKKFPTFLKTSLMLLVAGLLGIGTYANHLLPTYEYSNYTMRGGSELTHNEGADVNRNGLQLDYATQWCYGPSESFNLLIPNFNGGSSSGALGEDSHMYKSLTQAGYNARQVIGSLPLYWGPQPFTAGPMYMGALVIFLFVVGLFLIKGPWKWALAGVSLLALLLSWGSHFMPLTEFFFRHVPLYNKFRTVSMILVILQMTLPILGILAVQALFQEDVDRKKKQKALIWGLGLTGGFCALMAIMPSLGGSFSGAADSQLPNQLIAPLVADRINLLQNDAIRSALIIAAAAIILWLSSLRKTIKPIYGMGILLLLVIVDYWSVDKRYLNDSHFVTAKAFENQFAPRLVDKTILEDPDLYYRVLDLSVNTFNDASVSYYHKSIGGYNAAKLQRYQDVIDHYIFPEMQSLVEGLNASETYDQAISLLAKTPVLNMLNAKYIVLGGEAQPLLNSHAYGNAWVINHIQPVSGADEEIAALGTVDLSSTAVMTQLPDDWKEPEETLPAEGSVTLTKYEPNTLEYKAIINQDALVVFSDIYYPKGWKAWIDQKDVRIYRANYITRALMVPAGEHNIRFSFEPQSYVIGEKISKASSALVWLLLLGCVAIPCVRCVRKQQKNKGTEK